MTPPRSMAEDEAPREPFQEFGDGEDRRQSDRRDGERRLHAIEVALNGQHVPHQLLAQQMASIALALDRQTKATQQLVDGMPALVGEGFAAGVRTVVADPELMQHAGRGLLSALGDIGTKATGNAVIGWVKGAVGKILPFGLILLLALWLGGPGLAAKAGAWLLKHFGTTGG